MKKNCSNCRDWKNGFCQSPNGVNAYVTPKYGGNAEVDLFRQTRADFYCSDWGAPSNWEKSPEEQKAAQAWEKRMKERKERRWRRGKFTFTYYGLNLRNHDLTD